MSDLNYTNLAPPHLCDLAFHVGGPENNTAVKAYRLISAPLRMHSKAFNSMLSGGWKEKVDKDEPITLPDDDPWAFKASIDIMSFRLKSSDPAPTSRQLLSLTKFADKWNLVEIVKDCVAHWVNRVLLADGDALRPDEQCYVGWTLHLRNVFKNGWHKLVDRTEISSFGTWRICSHLNLPGQSWRAQTDLLPDRMLDEIRHVATNRLHELHQATQRFARKAIFYSDIVGCTKWESSQSEICRNTQIGGIMQTLGTCHVPLILDATAIASSSPRVWDGVALTCFTDRLKHMTAFKALRGHAECGPAEEWKLVIEKIMTKAPALTSSQEEHFARFEN